MLTQQAATIRCGEESAWRVPNTGSSTVLEAVYRAGEPKSGRQCRSERTVGIDRPGGKSLGPPDELCGISARFPHRAPGERSPRDPRNTLESPPGVAAEWQQIWRIQNDSERPLRP